MTDNQTDQNNKTVQAPPPRKGGGPGSRGGAIPAEKAKNFTQTIGRIISMILKNKVDRIKCLTMVFFLVISAGVSAYAPTALGNATNVLFDGLVSKQVTQTVECSILPNMGGVTLDQFKSQVDDDKGHLDLDKMMNLMKGKSSSVSGTPSTQNLKLDPIKADIDPQFKLGAPQIPDYCKSAQNSSDEFDANSSGLDSIKTMLSKMEITLGAGVNFIKFGWFLLLVCGLYALTFFTRWISGWLAVRIVSNLTRNLRDDIEKKLWKLPLNYYDKNSRGDIMSRTTNDLDNITQSLQQTGGDMIYMILMVVGVVIMMFKTSWILAIISLITIPVAFSIVAIIMKKAQPQFKQQWAKTGSLNAHIEESFTGHILIKSYGKQENFKNRFDEENDGLFKSAFKAQFISQMIMPVMGFFTNINYVIIALVGAIRIANGQISLGEVQAFIQYSRQYSQPLGQIAQMMNLLQSGAASAERIFELLDADEMEDDSDKESKLDAVKGEIVFEGVDFSYDPKVSLIKAMNLTAKPGKTVAIVGPTGAGKTTLVNLIMRFYEVDKGKIYLDGVDTRNIQRQTLRKNIGMVLQDTWLFKGTIEENLKYGVLEGKEIDDETFMKACKATYVDHFVSALPKGYQTVLDDEGSEISVGEKQLLTIARAFLADPEILILDEATSSVDTRTEVLVQKAMNALKKNRTSFVIAHRLSTIRDADTIVVMEKGAIVEQGNHSQLIKKKNGHYAALYQSQFEEEAED